MRTSTLAVLGVSLLLLATGASAQYAAPAGGAAASAPAYLDCPPPAAGAGTSAGAAASPVGTPQGAGQGSGLTALPSTGGAKRVEGAIRAVDSTRTNRIIEVGDVKLEVEPSTVILVNCKAATTADLKEGASVKAAYEVKENNRNVATVIEAK